MDNTVLYLQLHRCLHLSRKHWQDGASPDWCCEHLIAAYSFIYPERLSRPDWLTYSGRFTHISGHPSAVGRVQDRESSPVKDQRSTAVPRSQPVTVNETGTYLALAYAAHFRRVSGYRCFVAMTFRYRNLHNETVISVETYLIGM